MNNELKQLKLQNSVDEALIHLKRIFYANTKIKDFFPVSKDFLSNIEDENIEHIDQFIYRFMKFQDCIGIRLFPSLLENLEEDFKNRPFIDILNRLEQLEILNNTDVWLQLRELKNNIAHEYPDNTDENIAALNMLFGLVPELIAVFDNIIVYLNKIIKINPLPDWYYAGLFKFPGNIRNRDEC